jgi:uncharacterized membrane protein (DUF4010 family)
VLLSILAIVVYPALPKGAIDPYGSVEPRAAWITVILMAGIGFVNYVLWKSSSRSRYGRRTRGHEAGIAIAFFPYLGSQVRCDFLALQVSGALAQRQFGEWGLYATSIFGGLVSSASAVAAAATLAANGTISAQTAGVSAVIASLMSVLSNRPLVMRARNRDLTSRLGVVLGIIMSLGVAGGIGQKYVLHLVHPGDATSRRAGPP